MPVEDLHNEIKEMREEIATVNKIFHELKIEKESQKVKFWRLVSLILTIAVIASNVAWGINRLQFEKIKETSTTETVTYDIDGIEQNAEGQNRLDIIGGDKIGNTEN